MSESRPLWNVTVRHNGIETVYEFDGETKEYVTLRANRSLEGDVVKVELIK